MKKPKRKPTKRQTQIRIRREAMETTHLSLEQLMQRLNALGDFDANAGPIRSLAAAVTLLYRDRLGKF
jgi:hypothetical protein